MKKQAIARREALLNPCCWVIMCCITVTSSVGAAKSLYLAGDAHVPGWDRLWAYDVQSDGRIAFQADSIYLDFGALGINGLSVDPHSNTLFTTYTGFSNAGVVDTESLEFGQFIYLVPWDMHAGGITYDESRSRAYMTDDGKDRLLLYNWIPEIPGLHNIGYGASEVFLSRPNAGAIAYDPDRDIVYVASIDHGIEMLKVADDRADWEQVGSIGTAYEAQTLSLDLRNKYMYTGGWTDRGAVITQHNLATGEVNQIETSEDTKAILSVCVDSATSLIYALLSSANDPARTVRVYDSTFHLIQTVVVDGDALQLHIPSTSVGYNPLNTTIALVAGTVENNGQHTAVPGAEIQYEICMANTNLFPVTDIVVTDTLPDELEFVRAQLLGSALGVFDDLSNTYFYHNPSLDPNSTQCFSIVARVKNEVPSGVVISNSVAVDSNETVQSGAGIDVEVGYNTLGLTKTVVDDPNNLQVGDTIYVDAGAHVTYQICLSNLNNSSALSNVLVVDQLSEHVEFVSADQVGLISHYDEITHSHSWAFEIIEPNYLDCFNIKVRVKDDVPPGETITNEVLLGSSDSSTVTVKADVVVKYGALAVTIGIADSPGYNPETMEVVTGSILNYIIDVNNHDPLYDAQNVIVIDSVPEGLEFLGASSGDVNGVYDPLSRTYTLQQPVLGPGQGIHVELICLVSDDLPGNTVLTNSVIGMANGAPASNDSTTVRVFAPNSSVLTTLDLWYTGPLVRQDKLDEIMVVMTFPEHIKPEDIDTTQVLVMTPGPSRAYHRDLVEGLTTNYFVFAAEGRARVKGFFDRMSVLNALLPGQESVTITVTGLLKTGQSFVGRTSVSVN